MSSGVQTKVQRNRVELSKVSQMGELAVVAATLARNLLVTLTRQRSGLVMVENLHEALSNNSIMAGRGERGERDGG